jgi:transketolase C-terminal domain/subunit
VCLLLTVTRDALRLSHRMPREIVTVQLGQCGNQSVSAEEHNVRECLIEHIKWVLSTGSASALNTVSTKKAFLKTGQLKVEIAKTYSFTKRTTNTTYPEQFWLTWNLEYVHSLGLDYI